jgi:hypothetical protein
MSISFTTNSMEKLVSMDVQEIDRLHGVPVPIVSDRDTLFISNFLKRLHEVMGTKLNFSPAYHSLTDGKSKRIVQILEDICRLCVLEFKGNGI